MKKNNKLAAAIAANVENQVTGIINAESTTSKKETSAKAKKTSKPKAKVKELPAAKKEAKSIKPDLTDDTDNDDLVDDDSEEEVGAGFKPALSHLSDKGILEFNDADIEDSEEGFEKALDLAIEHLQVSKDKFLSDQVLKTERDRKLFFDTIENPRELNEALKKAYESSFFTNDF